MPGTNLTRDEAATRAALLDVTSYSIDLDLTTGETDLRLDHHDRVHLPRARRRDVRRPGRRDRSTRSRSTASPWTPSAYADNRIALTGLAADNTLVVRADCTYSHTGEGLHRFVDPVDDRVYLYSQFEVPDARRVYTTFEQPDLKAPYTFTVTAPDALEGRLQRRRRPQPRGPGDGKAVWRFPATMPMSTYVTALVAGEYHEVTYTYTGQARRDPARPLLPPVAGRAPRRRRDHQGHRAGLRVLRGGLRLPLPVRQVRPAVRAGVQHGRDGERRLRHLPRRVPPAQPPGPLVLRVPRRGDPPRDGAHVVRRPGDHEVVGRPLAQRVVRRVGAATTRRSTPPSSPRRGPASPTPARTGPTARTSCPAPTRSPPTTTTCRPSR